MSKTLIISDLHSNIIALEEVWKKESDADLVICAGDVVDYGPYPSECIDWLIDKKALVVSGNHDREVVEANRNPIPDDQITWCFHNARKLRPKDVEYLDALPMSLKVTVGDVDIGVSHAFRDYKIIRSVEDFENFSQELFDEVLHHLVFGHTHRRGIHYLDDTLLWMNPGSIAYRRRDENRRGAHYIVHDETGYHLNHVDFPTDILVQELSTLNLLKDQIAVANRWWLN